MQLYLIICWCDSVGAGRKANQRSALFVAESARAMLAARKSLGTLVTLKLNNNMLVWLSR